jgi:hypothetical protein
VAGELQKRQRGRGGTGGGARGGVEREVSECSEGAKEAKGEKEVQWTVMIATTPCAAAWRRRRAPRNRAGQVEGASGALGAEVLHRHSILA